MTEQTGQPAAKRQQIIQGAELVFTRDGYEGASMSQIAAEAGVSKGTLYNYFDSKSSLFAFFVEQKASRLLAGMFDTASDEEDLATALRAIAMHLIEMLLSDDGLLLYRIVVAEARKFPHLATTFWEAGPSRVLDHMTSWICRQQGAGRLLAGDPAFAAEQFMALCQTRLILRRRLQIIAGGSDTEVAEVVEGAVRLFLSGYATDVLASTRLKS